MEVATSNAVARQFEKVMSFILAPAAVLLLAAIVGWVPQIARIRLQRERRGAPLFGESRTLTLAITIVTMRWLRFASRVDTTSPIAD